MSADYVSPAMRPLFDALHEADLRYLRAPQGTEEQRTAARKQWNRDYADARAFHAAAKMYAPTCMWPNMWEVYRDLAVIARAEAARMRTLAHQSISADAMLSPVSLISRALNAGYARFTPRFVGTIGWTDEAREAFYRRTPRFA